MSYIAEGDGPDFKPGEDVQRIPPTVVVFYGLPSVFFLAICMDCAGGGRPTPIPFGSEAERARWLEGHLESHSNVDLAVEVRP
jgi:hypothetical protein